MLELWLSSVVLNLLGGDLFGDEQPSHKGFISDILHVSYLHFDFLYCHGRALLLDFHNSL